MKPRRIAVSAEGWVPKSESLKKTGSVLLGTCRILSTCRILKKEDIRRRAFFDSKQDAAEEGEVEKRRVTVVVERLER